MCFYNFYHLIQNTLLRWTFGEPTTNTTETIKEHKYYFYHTPDKLNLHYFTLSGKLHGEHKIYDKYGNLIHYSKYINGLLQGNSIEYNIFIIGDEEKMTRINKYIHK